jgi:transcriptional regulator with XRE-family HTH domain
MTSCRPSDVTFEFLANAEQLAPRLALLRADLPFNRFGDPRGRAETDSDPPHMLRGDVLFTSDFAVIDPDLECSSDFAKNGAKLGVQIETPRPRGIYRDAYMSVKQNIGVPIRSEALARIAPRIKELRLQRGMTQAGFAQEIGVSQVQVSQWERGIDLPSVQAFLTIAKLAPDVEHNWWLQQAGLDLAMAPVRSIDDVKKEVPLVKDSSLVGTARATEDKNIEVRLALPASWLPKQGNMQAFRMRGDAMQPVLSDGFTIIVNTLMRDPALMTDLMVAVREHSGVTVRCLRRDGEIYLLEPKNPNSKTPTRVMREQGDYSLVGFVVAWIGGQKPHKRGANG